MPTRRPEGRGTRALALQSTEPAHEHPTSPMSWLPSDRPPTHPGTMLREEFLEPLALSQAEVARAIGVPYQRFNEVVRGVRGVTPWRMGVRSGADMTGRRVSG